MIQKIRDHAPSRKVTVILFVIIGLLVLGGVGGVAYLKFFADSSAANDSSNTAKTAAPTPPPAVDHTVKTYSNPDLGIMMAIPSYWKEERTSATGTILTAVDDKLAISLEYTRAAGNHAPCGYAIQDSELVKYTSPAEGQRTETNLSYLGNKEDPNKLCAIMITGPKSFTQGEMFNTVNPSPEIIKQLPSDLIVATFSLADDSSKHPDFVTAQNTTLYLEVIDALKSLQIK